MPPSKIPPVSGNVPATTPKEPPPPAAPLPLLSRVEIKRIHDTAGTEWQCGAHETNKVGPDGAFMLDKHDRLIKERLFVRCTVRAIGTGRIVHVQELDGQDQEQCISDAARAIASKQGIPLVVMNDTEQLKAALAEQTERLARLEAQLQPKLEGSTTGPGQTVPPQ